MAKKRKAHVEPEPEVASDDGAVAGEVADLGSDHLLAPGPEIAEEVWEGDEDAIVIEPDDAEPAEAPEAEHGTPTDGSAESVADDEAIVIEPDDGSEPFVSAEAPDSGRSADTNVVDDEADYLADTIDSEIHELATERDTYRDIAQRLQADFENYRKRMGAQLAGEIDRATGKLAEALLPVLDAAEAAYVQHPDEIGPLFNLMLAELRKQGLEPIDLLEKPFDPNLAEAVAHEPGDGGEPVVTEVMRSGYLWNGRTLRPAMVRTRD